VRPASECDATKQLPDKREELISSSRTNMEPTILNLRWQAGPSVMERTRVTSTQFQEIGHYTVIRGLRAVRATMSRAAIAVAPRSPV
jgi:hypothetical protein